MKSNDSHPREYYDKFMILTGVPQGSIIGPVNLKAFCVAVLHEIF